MLRFILVLIAFIWLVKLFKKNKNSNDISGKSNYLAGDLHNKAEDLRKNKKATKAINSYWQSIKEGEKSKDWKEYGPAPAMYRELAKVYYHTGNDKKAVDVLDRYLKLKKKSGYSDSKIKKLRNRMKSGDFRRLKNKYK